MVAISKERTDSLAESVAIRVNCFKIKEGRFILDIRKKFFFFLSNNGHDALAQVAFTTERWWMSCLWKHSRSGRTGL